MNANLPPIPCFVHGNYFGVQTEAGHLISVRSIANQALQFSVLLDSGALMTGVPAHFIGFSKFFTPLNLQTAQMWDSISNVVQCISFDTLRWMRVSVKTDDRLINGKYLFSIDYDNANDLSAHPIHWKQMHIVQSDCDRLLVYPQYRIRFLDAGLCQNSDQPLPQYKNNSIKWEVGS